MLLLLSWTPQFKLQSLAVVRYKTREVLHGTRHERCMVPKLSCCAVRAVLWRNGFHTRNFSGVALAAFFKGEREGGGGGRSNCRSNVYAICYQTLYFVFCVKQHYIDSNTISVNCEYNNILYCPSSFCTGITPVLILPYGYYLYQNCSHKLYSSGFQFFEGICSSIVTTLKLDCSP